MFHSSFISTPANLHCTLSILSKYRFDSVKTLCRAGVQTDLPLLAVNVSDAVGQRVGSQQRGGALRPVHRHQRVLAHQDLAHVLGARHPDQGPTQEVGLEHVAVLLSP